MKEIREIPWKGHCKFVKFFDVWEINGQYIGGRRVKIEFSRPGGQGRMKAESRQRHLSTMLLDFKVLITHNREDGIQIKKHVPRQHQLSWMFITWVLASVRVIMAHTQVNGFRHSSAAAWKAHNRKNGSQVIHQFAFDEAEAISSCTKARTTVMIKNIPNKYKYRLILVFIW